MPTIKVEREAATVAAFASAVIKLDGRRVGRVKSGETLTFEASPGSHVLRAHLFGGASRQLRFSVTAGTGALVVEMTTSRAFNDTSDMGSIRSLLRPRSAYVLRLKDEQDESPAG